MSGSARILLIEDDANLAANLRQVLEDEGFSVTHASRGDEGLRRAGTGPCDVVLTDLRLPGLGGLELVRQLHEAQPHLPLILMTAHGTIETAIEATKRGAYDYLQKPFEIPELLRLLNKAVAAGRIMREPVALSDAPDGGQAALIGVSRAMQEVCKEVGRVAAKPVTVLIRGETGTGKELIARAIYQHSSRAKAPFIAINCGAVPENLLESELFGHERGAFTGADQRRIGRFEQANKGTLFLDEIGDLPPQTQVKLLRVLQEQSFHRVGGTETIHVDVRILAATHRDLETMIRDGRFREDLWHRLNVVATAVKTCLCSCSISSTNTRVSSGSSRLPLRRTRSHLCKPTIGRVTSGNWRMSRAACCSMLAGWRSMRRRCDAHWARGQRKRKQVRCPRWRVNFWRVLSAAKPTVLMPNYSPKPSARFSPRRSCWRKEIKPKPRGGLGCQD